MNKPFHTRVLLTLLLWSGSLVHAGTISVDDLALHLDIRLRATDRAELDTSLATYSAGASPRALAATSTADGRLMTTQATGMRFPAEAAVEALSRCERLRSMLTGTGTSPCELVHHDDRWIETTRSLMRGLVAESPAPVWRIDGGRSTVWLAGSVHVLKGPFYPLPAALDNAFAAADRIALEIDPTRMGEADRRLAARSAMTASPDQVKLALGTQRLAALAPLVQRHGIDPGAALSMKPAILATQISVAEMAALGYLPDQGIDLHYARRAGVEGKGVLELETVEQQMQALAGSPLDVQAQMLDATLDQLPEIPELVGEMLRAWLRADVDRLYALMMADFEGSAALQTLGRRILDDRNKLMHAKIRGWLDDGQSTLVIVGAGHLGGAEGLLRLLAADGYQVIPLARTGEPLPAPHQQPLERTGTE